MIVLRHNQLVFSFPNVHSSASIAINFQRTLRIPDDGKQYPLPPGLGNFSLRHVDDFARRVPPVWVNRGGVMLPMHQSEAMWLHFAPSYNTARGTDYPFAIKVAAGKINAVTGQTWTHQLHDSPQDYLVAPDQPWLDGFCVSKGVVRQFVAMPLGNGYSDEEQITDAAEHGGVQLLRPCLAGDRVDLAGGNFYGEGIGGISGGAVAGTKMQPHGFALVHGQHYAAAIDPCGRHAPREIVHVSERKVAEPRRQRVLLAVVGYAQGALEVDRDARRTVNVGE
jgi:hypothetical protein